MKIDTCLSYFRVAAVTLLSLGLVSTAQSQQAQTGVVTSAPSRNAATQRESDSLTLHFIRAPKAKQNSADRASGATAAKWAPAAALQGAAAVADSAGIIQTPIPSKRGKPIR
jgi:hypothetical protein